jgi:hypothetical protein
MDWSFRQLARDQPKPGAPRWAGPGAAAILLAAFYFLLLASAADKSLTADETRHATAGYTYWRFDDYRLNPGNGTLAQRIMALPLLGGRFRFPSTGSAGWRQSDELAVGDAWFNHSGNDVGAMLARGRAVCALFAVALAALVWGCARGLLGPRGAMVSLLLCVLNPTLLANGPLMTSDTACALLLLASTLAWWRLLERLTLARVLASAAIMGALFVTKMSAALILPIAGILTAVRLLEARPLPAAWGGCRAELRRGGMALGLIGAAAAHLAVVVLIVWAAFGFRYSAFGDRQPGRDRLSEPWENLGGQPPPAAAIAELNLTQDQRTEILRRLAAHGIASDQWTWPALDLLPEIKREVLTPAQSGELDAILATPPASPVLRLLAFIDRHRLLPQAYTYGWAFIRKATQEREAFFNGEYSLTGWRSFFPYTALVKTPLPVFGILVLALAAIGARWVRLRRRDGTPLLRSALGSLSAGLPLVTLFAVYWAAAITSHLNIGHRHLLPTYPPLFILGGAAAAWWSQSSDGVAGGSAPWWRGAAPGLALAGLLAVAAAETIGWFPNYLSYFNALAGGADHAYRHLVDSSLDWGQDLPGAQRYVAAHPQEAPFYLSYFGVASPATYGIGAQSLNPLPSPLQSFSIPADREAEGIADLRRAHPDFDVVAVGSHGAQESVLLLERPEALRLRPGTYLISATMLQWGPWDPHYEATYQRLYREAQPLLGAEWSARMAALRGRDPAAWTKLLNDFNLYRVSRLAVFLRRREPARTINGSILVYHLGAEDLKIAFDGPAPESVPDPRVSGPGPSGDSVPSR